MSDMDSLIKFLRARLAEDEQAARAAIGRLGGEWVAYGSRVEVAGDTRDAQVFEYTVCFDEGSPSPEQADHIARHDPARVLRDVEAKRRLLVQFELRGNSVRSVVRPSTGGVWDDLLRILALPYADHEDYRPEWRP